MNEYTGSLLPDEPIPAEARARVMRAARDAILNMVTTEGSPAEWLAQRMFPGFKSTNQAGIYAKNPDLDAMTIGMGGALKAGRRIAKGAEPWLETGIDVGASPYRHLTKTQRGADATRPAQHMGPREEPWLQTGIEVGRPPYRHLRKRKQMMDAAK